MFVTLLSSDPGPGLGPVPAALVAVAPGGVLPDTGVVAEAAAGGMFLPSFLAGRDTQQWYSNLSIDTDTPPLYCSVLICS